MLKKLIDKFLKRNSKSLESSNIIHEMNGVVLLNSGDKDFEFKNTVVNEVVKYCSNVGIEKVDKVIILSLFDTDIFNPKRKIIFNQQQISDSESKIIVIEEEGKIIAQVFFREYLEIKGDN